MTTFLDILESRIRRKSAVRRFKCTPNSTIEDFCSFLLQFLLIHPIEVPKYGNEGASVKTPDLDSNISLMKTLALVKEANFGFQENWSDGAKSQDSFSGDYTLAPGEGDVQLLIVEDAHLQLYSDGSVGYVWEALRYVFLLIVQIKT